MVNAQEYLDGNYPAEERINLIELDISDRYLEGSLKLTGFINLEKLNCSNNLITSIDISDLNPEKLCFLNLRDNRFEDTNIEIFSNFLQLEELLLGRTQILAIFNDFYGSLKSLANLKKLKTLCISDTKVNEDLEYVPENVKEFFLSEIRETLTGEDLGIKKVIEDILSCDDDLRKWKNKQLLKKVQHLERSLLISKDLINSFRSEVGDSKLKIRNLEQSFEESNGLRKTERIISNKAQQRLLEEKENEIQQVRNNLEEFSKKFQDLETEKSQLEKKQQSLEKKLVAANSNVSKLKSDNKQLKKETSNFKKERDDEIAKRKHLESDKETLQNKLDLLQGERSNLEEEIKDLLSQIEIYQQANAAIREKYEEIMQRNTNLCAKIELN